MEYKSLYQYLGRAAGSELGKKVMNEAVSRGIKYQKQEVDPRIVSSGFVYSYPVDFLNDYFKKEDLENKVKELEYRLRLLENKVFEEDKLLGEGIAFPADSTIEDELPF